MGTPAGANTRRYHGCLVAAVNPPAERWVLLANVECFAVVHGRSLGLSTNQYVGALHPNGYERLAEFSVGSYAEWVWDVGDGQVRKRLAMHPGVDACTLEYTNLTLYTVTFVLRPLVSHKEYHGNFRKLDFYPDRLSFGIDRTVLTHREVTLHLEHPGANRMPTSGWYYRFEHQVEVDRGLEPVGDLFCPCELTYEVPAGGSVSLVASTEEAQEPYLFNPEPLAESASVRERLERAAEAFLVSEGPRSTIIAGYPWFTDWGRDTFISLPGLCLCTGRIGMAKSILRSFASQMHQGLIPNRFVEHGVVPEYNTVDGTLWFVNAAWKTLQSKWDADLAAEALAWVRDVVEWHVEGTLYGISVDHKDGLLTQGAPGMQLTWMDAKVGDWVVTPRHGKPIEVCGLWLNALRIGLELALKLGEDTSLFERWLTLGSLHFERKFWRQKLGHYLDTVDPDDASLRPNQVIAMGLPFSPLADGSHATKAIQKVTQELLTQHGLRTLGPKDPSYHGRFEGSMAERDAAYHQGTVWPWLLGSYVTALVRVSGSKEKGRSLLERSSSWLEERGLGGIAEVYDGDEPQRPDGCPWQAWSVAELLRAWVEDCGEHQEHR